MFSSIFLSKYTKCGDDKMELTFLQMMILYCLQKINGERTIYSIYHLLHGKKSSQTIQDATFISSSSFFSIHIPTISRKK